jgi:hypothetical protein
VEAAGETDDLEPACVHLRQLERDLIGLGAGVEKDDFVEPGRGERGQPLGECEHGLGEHPRVQVDDLVERAPDRSDDPRVVMPERRADLAGRKVEHPLPVCSLDPCPVGASDEKRGEAAGVSDEEAFAGVAHLSSLSCSATAAVLSILSLAM